MATLNTITPINRSTIADGDKLNTNFESLHSNDELMLAETISTNGTTQSVFNTVKNNSATNWDNSLIHNFSDIKVGNTTLRGKSKLASTLTLTGSDTIKLEKNSSKYSFKPSDAIEAVSSYYKFANFENSLALSRLSVDPFMFESTWVALHYGTFLLYDKFSYKSYDGQFTDGFNKSPFGDMTVSDYLNTLSAKPGVLESLPYSATTVILDKDTVGDERFADIRVLSHTIPTRGSFLYCDDLATKSPSPYPSYDAYGGATVVDNGSIAIGNKVFAKDYSIGFKGCSAEAYSVCLLGANSNAGFVVNSIAKTSSFTIGTDVIASGKSFYLSDSVTVLSDNSTNRHFPKNHSAVDCSFGIYSTDSITSNISHSAGVIGALSVRGTLNIDNSIALSPKSNTTIENKSISLGGKTDNEYSHTYNHSIVMTPGMPSITDSLALSVKGMFTSDSYMTRSVGFTTDIDKKAEITDSLIAAVSINNQCLYATSAVILGTRMSDVLHDDMNYAYKAIVFPTFAYSKLTQNLMFGAENDYYLYDTCYKNNRNIYALNNSYEHVVYGYHVVENPNHTTGWVATYLDDVDIKPNIGYNNICIKGMLWDARTGLDFNNPVNNNTIINACSHSTKIGGLATNNMLYSTLSYLKDVKNSYLHSSSAEGHDYYGVKKVIFNTVGYFRSKLDSCDSFALCNSHVDESYYMAGIASQGEPILGKNYCLALFDSTACYRLHIDDTPVIEKDRFGLWNNRLSLKHLPHTKFEKISSISTLNSLDVDKYYIITG